MIFKSLLSRSVQTPNSDKKNWQTSCPLQTFVCNISRRLQFIIGEGHRVSWVSRSLDSRVLGRWVTKCDPVPCLVFYCGVSGRLVLLLLTNWLIDWTDISSAAFDATNDHHRPIRHFHRIVTLDYYTLYKYSYLLTYCATVQGADFLGAMGANARIEMQ